MSRIFNNTEVDRSEQLDMVEKMVEANPGTTIDKVAAHFNITRRQAEGILHALRKEGRARQQAIATGSSGNRSVRTWEIGEDAEIASHGTPHRYVVRAGDVEPIGRRDPLAAFLFGMPRQEAA